MEAQYSLPKLKLDKEFASKLTKATTMAGDL